MKMLAPRRAVRALLALMVLLAPLSAWTAAVPAGGGTRAERAIVHTMSRGEQVVLADRQPLLRAVVDRRGDVGRSRSVLLGILVGAALLGGQKAAAGELVLADEQGARLRLGSAALSGGVVGDARAELDPQFQTRWQVAIEFRDTGGRQWAQLTGKAACEPAGDPGRRVAIVLDRQVISSPQVDPSVRCGQGISGGTTVITGDFTDKEARDLALLIRAGALPVPVQVVD